MSITESKNNLFRTQEDINIIVQFEVHSYLSIMDRTINGEQRNILNKLKDVKLTINPQIIHLLESPLDNFEFKDLMRQLVKPILIDLMDEAIHLSSITKEEKELILPIF